MINTFMLVGRLKDSIEKDEDKYKMTLIVPRSYKNGNGEYETDFVDVAIDGILAKTTIEYCKKGDIIGVKGFINGQNNKMTLNAEKITFLSSSKE